MDTSTVQFDAVLTGAAVMACMRTIFQKECVHKEKRCEDCGLCFKRKCCRCSGGPPRRAYKRQAVQIDSPGTSSSDSEEKEDSASDRPCVSNHYYRHGACAKCGHCGRHCTCAKRTPPRAKSPRAAKRCGLSPGAYAELPEADADSSADNGIQNTLHTDAVRLGLPEAVQAAAARSRSSRLADSVDALPVRKRQRLLQAAEAAFQGTLTRWAPNDPRGLYMLLRQKLDTAYGVEDADMDSAVYQSASALLHTLPRRSRESRAILAVFASISRAAAVSVLECLELDGESEDSSEDEEELDSDNSEAEHDDVQAEDPAVVTSRKRARLTKWAYLRARDNYRRMLCGLPIVKPPATRARRSNVAVAGVVNFLYRRENSSTLSWGHKRLEVNGKMEVISAHNRLRSRNRLWQQYNAETTAAAVEPRNRLRRTAFFAVVGQITTRDLKVWCFIVLSLIAVLSFVCLLCV